MLVRPNKFSPIETCYDCSKTIPRSHTTLVLERKVGILTGKQKKLCPKCRVKFFDKGDEKDKVKGDKAKDLFQQWNKEESSIWTPN